MNKEVQKINNGDPKLKYILEKEGKPDISIIGFPSDIKGLQSKKLSGVEYGPDCLRRFLPKLGPILNAEYQVDISDLNLKDFGNINENLEIDQQFLQAKEKINYCLNNQIFPIMIGGSNDICQAFQIENEYDGYLFIDNDIDLINNFQQDKYQFQIQKKQQKEFSKNIFDPITETGIAFQDYIQSIQKQKIHVQLSLDTMDPKFCPGISNKSQGLNSQEIIEIMLLIGGNSKFKSISITDYNSTIEDFRTGRLLTNMIYHVLLAFKKFRK